MKLTAKQRDCVAENINLIGSVAATACKRYGRKLAYHEAFSSAALGACQAVKSYIRRRGANLATHIHRRAAGQIIDDIRQVNGNSRTMAGRRRQRETSLEGVVDWRSMRMNDLTDPDVMPELAVEDEALAMIDHDDAFGALARDVAGGNWRMLRVLHLIYMQGMSWDKATRQVGRSQSWLSLKIGDARKRMKARAA